MEGLNQFSIVKFSDLDKIKNRYDSEYYLKQYLKLDAKINSIGKVTVFGIGAKLDCSAFYPSITEYYNFNNLGVPFLRVNDIQNGLLSIGPDTAFLPQELLNNNQSTIALAYPDDIIIAKGGNTLAKLGLITNQYPYYALSRDLILLKTKGIEEYNKYFLWVFLYSKYGQGLLWRTASQTGQPHLTLPSIGDINLPKYSLNFEEQFEHNYKKSCRLKEKSRDYYSQAENLLLQSIGLKGFQPTKESVNVKSFKDSFLTTGRLDAEYYQLKYEDYLGLINNYAKGSEKLEKVIHLKDKNLIPKETLSYKYIELSNIGKYGGITGCTNAKGDELPSRARRKVREGDVVISSIEGSLESCALVTKEYDNALCSTGFYIINSDKINSETLLVLFKSELMQNILKQGCSGTILTAINKDEFLNIPIPLIDKTVQVAIKNKVNESIALRQQSVQLLEAAKRAVEIAIEQNEEKGLEYLEKQERVN